VKVCGAPISFVAFGTIEIRAVAQFFVALGLSPACASPVSRWSETPPTDTVVAALIDVWPAVGELITTVQLPVPPAVVQVLGPTNEAVAPFEFVSENEMTVPFGAFT